MQSKEKSTREGGFLNIALSTSRKTVCKVRLKSNGRKVQYALHKHEIRKMSSIFYYLLILWDIFSVFQNIIFIIDFCPRYYFNATFKITCFDRYDISFKCFKCFIIIISLKQYVNLFYTFNFILFQKRIRNFQFSICFRI